MKELIIENVSQQLDIDVHNFSNHLLAHEAKCFAMRKAALEAELTSWAGKLQDAYMVPPPSP